MSINDFKDLLRAAAEQPQPQRHLFVFVAKGIAEDATADMVFVAAMSGQDGRSPAAADAEWPLQHLVESIKSGRIDRYLTFDVRGQPVQFC